MIVCRSCGFHNADADAFCGSCGNFLEWTGEKVYARLFDRPTTIRTDENWLFFNVEGLSSDPKLETAMSMVIANAMSSRASGRPRASTRSAAGSTPRSRAASRMHRTPT